MALLNPPKSSLRPIHVSKLGDVRVTLHRRGLRWYLVHGRAQDAAADMKLVAALNDPGTRDTDPKSPFRQSHSHDRFWLRDGADCQGGNTMLSAEGLLGDGIEPPFLRDTGMRRMVILEEKERRDEKTNEKERLIGGIGQRFVEERLVQVLLDGEQLSQRCAYCGSWEYCDEGGRRHSKVLGGSDGTKVYYWCGNCSRAAKPFKKYWWMNPEKLDDSVYFHCRLP